MFTEASSSGAHDGPALPPRCGALADRPALLDQIGKNRSDWSGLMLGMKPSTFALIVGLIVAFGGGIVFESVTLLVVGLLIMVGARFVKWPQSHEGQAAEEQARKSKQERRDERARALARKFRR